MDAKRERLPSSIGLSGKFVPTNLYNLINVDYISI